MLVAFSSRVKLFVFYLHRAAVLIAVRRRTHSTSSWRYAWCDPQYANACHECVRKECNASVIGFIANLKQNMWMAHLDCFAIWIFECPRLEFLREVHPTNHESADTWILFFQQTMSSWYQLEIRNGFDGKILQRMPEEKASKVLRRPSSLSTAAKQPASGSSFEAAFFLNHTEKPGRQQTSPQACAEHLHSRRGRDPPQQAEAQRARGARSPSTRSGMALGRGAPRSCAHSLYVSNSQSFM